MRDEKGVVGGRAGIGHPGAPLLLSWECNTCSRCGAILDRGARRGKPREQESGACRARPGIHAQIKKREQKITIISKAWLLNARPVPTISRASGQTAIKERLKALSTPMK
jgi:hypothetical protein